MPHQQLGYKSRKSEFCDIFPYARSWNVSCEATIHHIF